MKVRFSAGSDDWWRKRICRICLICWDGCVWVWSELGTRHPIFPDESALTVTVDQQISDSCTINSDWDCKEESDEGEGEEEKENKVMKMKVWR